MKLIFVKTMLVIFFGMFLVLSSCAKKSSSSQNRTGANPRGDTAAVTTTLGIAKCADGSSVDGRIIETGLVDYRTSWLDFLSAIMAADQVGELSGAATATTGVNIQLKIKVVNNQLSLADTRLALDIKDSFVNQVNQETNETIQSIKANFTSADPASTLTNPVSGTGNFTLVFADGYGKITVTGTYNQTIATGTVTFANTKHYNNETAKSGTLGKFSLNSCGLFH